MSKCLITGGSGFIGKHFLKNIDGYVCVVRGSDKKLCSDTFTVHSINGDTDWSGAFDGIDVVVHLAGRAHSKNEGESESLEEYREVNTHGTTNLARQAAKAGVKRFIFVSSIGVNGPSTTNEPFNLGMKAEPQNPYARSKYEAELGLKKIADETGLEVIIVRPTLVYGPNAPGNFEMLTRLVSKLPILPFGFANNRRDFIAVQNLADLLVTCANHPNAAGHIFLASDNETVSIKEFTNAIAKGLGKKVFQLPIPVSIMRLVGKITGKSAMLEQLFGNLEVDSSNIQQVLGWTPPLTMEQAMASLKNADK
ncbi:UDP-glucose 4-epimerase [Salinivibrio kushneri]|uniref:NAD-dependent epimerase/dehydratase family protein n=1 Tax=Salinivibrio kushneri TaxID=1908198 RepID=UPI0009883D35|nr:NAD-dependent epimerase/dehydratase family protein [Salinivibrio kushneri]OOE40900.1 UDP-glucose 4-epimerase [Salinivibrio kushneri]